jgi:hypothetical protein
MHTGPIFHGGSFGVASSQELTPRQGAENENEIAAVGCNDDGARELRHDGRPKVGTPIDFHCAAEGNAPLP